jgi:hypothetical protein
MNAFPGYLFTASFVRATDGQKKMMASLDQTLLEAKYVLGN